MGSTVATVKSNLQTLITELVLASYVMASLPSLFTLNHYDLWRKTAWLGLKQEKATFVTLMKQLHCNTYRS